MSREGVMLAARDRARRMQAALGERPPELLGCKLIVLMEAPRAAAIATPADAGAPRDDPAAVAAAEPPGRVG
jgi:hypothetical protein